MYRGISVSSNMLCYQFLRLYKNYIPLREFISDIVMSRGNRRFLLTNLQVQIWGVTRLVHFPILIMFCIVQGILLVYAYERKKKLD